MTRFIGEILEEHPIQFNSIGIRKHFLLLLLLLPYCINLCVTINGFLVFWGKYNLAIWKLILGKNIINYR